MYSYGGTSYPLIFVRLTPPTCVSSKSEVAARAHASIGSRILRACYATLSQAVESDGEGESAHDLPSTRKGTLHLTISTGYPMRAVFGLLILGYVSGVCFGWGSLLGTAVLLAALIPWLATRSSTHVARAPRVSSLFEPKPNPTLNP